MEKAPLFQLPEMHSGVVYDVNGDIGKVIVLTFWVSWCPDCARDLPMKEQLNRSMDSNKVRMLTINVAGRERSSQAGEDFATKFLTQQTLVDDGKSIYEQYQCTSVPTTIIIDQEGFIAARFDDKAKFLEIVEKIGDLVD
ncbi:Thiol-disulfide isomerase or thioredoxin [Thalassobacillus cyri]|uniref:Thiol-disulfide isomerase or thioredoxin n=1 Tax=Thalassobacillus cyri TaxID=571932 RepID=A0A1H4GDM1_9BACI|nr:TlpA disulfide reductase family protein [Thalassobacillus cyri]SEB07733.1 Thiol-disulfide isomerase or thioredoxin [Thalassobacillus cyri]